MSSSNVTPVYERKLSQNVLTSPSEGGVRRISQTIRRDWVLIIYYYILCYKTL